MTVEYEDVSSAALRFNLIRAKVDLERLQPIGQPIECQVAIAGHTVQCEVGILGASHFMGLHFLETNACLTEVFACAELDGLDGRLYCGPLGASGEIDVVQPNVAPGISYHFRAWISAWAPSERTTLDELERAATQPQHAGVWAQSFEFPSADGSTTRRNSDQEAQRPVTVVHFETAPEQGILRTAHSYPNEGVIVWTRTSIEAHLEPVRERKP